jgi:translocator protein
MTFETLTLGGFIAANFAAAFSGAFFRPDAWYRGLRKPAFTPPDWLFPLAWAVLYLMNAVAGWLVFLGDGWGLPLGAYAISLVLNALWSALFFGLKRPDIAFAGLAALWLSLVAQIALFGPVSPLAAWLLAPYLVWVSFAGAVNLAVWRLNPDHGRAAA